MLPFPVFQHLLPNSLLSTFHKSPFRIALHMHALSCLHTTSAYIQLLLLTIARTLLVYFFAELHALPHRVSFFSCAPRGIHSLGTFLLLRPLAASCCLCSVTCVAAISRDICLSRDLDMTSLNFKARSRRDT